ncbi:DeoR/GlpR transcriptional regulator [Caloramator sp. E03]|uniref:DeoR/GlpR family DNA-binding transcription regulator n=1 Tax=Caloramator sp. E03 TaxID=2576307 RepID=UPI00111085AC|nr:DeoR/GlpR family DNA-binding transcription regulator [Caloramator sp. E03]QCX34406.1 DeoR/GlpR transcriptional regulator [Caloramator sp. E03]
MFSEERKMQIISLLKEQGNIKVSDLAKIYDVSEVTIRKDLQELEEEGLIKRVHGGAVLNNSIKFEPTFSEKSDKYIQEKESIGKASAKLIKDGDIIALDAGTTTLQIAKNITAKNLTVVTNSLDIAYQLSSKKDIEVIVTGSLLRWETRAFVGPLTDMTLKNIRVDKAFIGTNGISLKFGLTTPNITEANTKKTLISISQQIIVVCDHSKFNSVCFAKIVDIDEIDIVVTDSGIDKSIKKQFEKAGVELTISELEVN